MRERGEVRTAVMGLHVSLGLRAVLASSRIHVAKRVGGQRLGRSLPQLVRRATRL